MEDREILKQRRRSIMRRTQITCGLVGALLTIVGTIPLHSLNDLPSETATSNFLFQLYMAVMAPALWISHLLGMDQPRSFNPWAGFAVVVIVNTVLSLIIGTFAGLLISRFQTTQVRGLPV